MALTPIAWAKQQGRLVWWKVHERGGHFAALEVPELLWGDVEDFVRKVWGKKGMGMGEEGCFGGDDA